MSMSNEIAKLILDMLSDDGETEIQRNEMAQHLGCVPSQINYVISSRFTPEQGYIVESRRGGGGYINSSDSAIGANGGAPNGGTGTCQSTTNTNSKGKSFGGGGGGTDCKLNIISCYGGAGGAGGVYLRFHFDAA